MSFDPTYNGYYPAIRQTCDWTCSACSWAWLACSIGSYYDEYGAVQAIGYPHNINPQVGLTDGSGQSLAVAYAEPPLEWPSHCGGLSYDDAIQLAWQGPLLLGSSNWYHWTAVRGTDGTNLYLANPAPQWYGVYDLMSPDEFSRFAPWSGVWLAA